MKSLYEKRIKKLEETNLALNKTYQKLQTRMNWLALIFVLIIGYVLLEELL